MKCEGVFLSVFKRRRVAFLWLEIFAWVGWASALGRTFTAPTLPTATVQIGVFRGHEPRALCLYSYEQMRLVLAGDSAERSAGALAWDGAPKADVFPWHWPTNGSLILSMKNIDKIVRTAE